MITELLILVEGMVMGRVFEQTKKGGTLSFQYDPAWLALKDAFPLSVSMPRAKRLIGNVPSKPFWRICFPKIQPCWRPGRSGITFRATTRSVC